MQILVYRAPQMTVLAGEKEFAGRTYMVIAGNAEWTSGGGMRLSPGARTDDGELNLTIIPSNSKFRMITRTLPKVASGAHIHEPGISYFPGTTVDVRSDRPAPVELDGDLFGTTPATFTICPRAVRILCPKEPNGKPV